MEEARLIGASCTPRTEPLQLASCGERPRRHGLPVGAQWPNYLTSERRVPTEWGVPDAYR